MAEFSPSDAALEGFVVLRRNWRVVLGWAGFQVVAVVALVALMLAALLVAVPFAGDRGDANAIGAVLGVLVLGVGGIGVQMVMLGGLFRLMLRPDEPGFLHLRVSAAEVRLTAGVVITGLAAIALFSAALAASIWAGRISALLGAAVGAALVIFGYALVARLGLTPAIAFAERRISPAESWRRTRGQAWRLVGMGALVLCLMGLLAIVALLVVFILQGLLTGFSDLDLNGAETLTAHPGRWFFQVAAQLVLTPVFLVIGNAPWIAVYRVLGAPAAP